MKKIIISYRTSYTRVCIIEDGKLVEFWVEKESKERLVGNFYKGKVMNVIKGMDSAFVNIGLDRNAFLYAGDMLGCEDTEIQISKLNVKPGDEILVQVVKDEFSTKGAKISMNVSLAARGLILMPNVDYVCASKKLPDDEKKEKLVNYIESIRKPGHGYILRTQSVDCSEEELLQEANELEERWKNIQKKYAESKAPALVYKDESLAVRAVRDMLREDVEEVIVDNKKVYEELREAFPYICKKTPDLIKLYSNTEDILYAYHLTSQIDSLLERKVMLSNGANLIIDRTEALTVIDVNTGKYIGQKQLSETLFETNIIAAKEIARQLRLRNIGGIIVVDFIDMEDEEQINKLMEVLREELSKDRIRATAIDMTSLGLVEITRKKTRSMLDEVLLQPCPYCHGSGSVYSEEYITGKIKQDLNILFKNPKNSTVIVTVSTSVFNKVFSYKLFEKECLNEWKDRRIYLVPDESKHIEKYDIKTCYESIIDLPDTARLLF